MSLFTKHDVKAGVWAVLNARIERAQEVVDAEVARLDAEEVEMIKTIKTGIAKQKDKTLENAVDDIIGKQN